MVRLQRETALFYGALCYAIFFATFLYAAGFLGNFAVPKSIDSGAAGALGLAVAVNTGLLVVFALQHSIMARPGFKRALTRVVPRPIERSTYVLFSSVALLLLFWQWQPITQPVWELTGNLARGIAWAVFFGGFGMVLYSTFLIDHFDLFGLRQVFLFWREKPYTEKRFVTPGPYARIRHPLYVGWLVTFWATPDMSVGHLLFAAVASSYIFVAIAFEERDLLAQLGASYRHYRETTPMFIPRISFGLPRPKRTIRSGQTPAAQAR